MKTNDLYGFMSTSALESFRRIQEQFNNSALTIAVKELQQTIDVVKIPTDGIAAALQTFHDSTVPLTAAGCRGGGRGRAVPGESGAQPGRTPSGLCGGEPYGAGPQRVFGGCSAPLAGGPGGGQCEDAHHAGPVHRGGPLQPGCDSEGGGYALLRPSYLYLCDGAYGPLAGGHGDL